MEALKEYLAKNNLTHEEFAQSIGVSASAVSRYASGSRIPRSSHMRKIVDVTKGWVTPNDFVMAA